MHNAKHIIIIISFFSLSRILSSVLQKYTRVLIFGGHYAIVSYTTL